MATGAGNSLQSVIVGLLTILFFAFSISNVYDKVRVIYEYLTVSYFACRTSRLQSQLAHSRDGMERLICCGETFPLIIQLTVTAVDTAIVMMVSAGRWLDSDCSVSFEEYLGGEYKAFTIVFLSFSCVVLLASVALLFLGRFQVRRRPLWVYYQHLSSILLFFALITRVCYFAAEVTGIEKTSTHPGTLLTLDYLFGIFFPLIISVCALQLLIWAEIARPEGRTKLGVIFHVVNFTLFVAEIVVLVLYTQIKEPAYIKIVATVWRTYTFLVIFVQGAGFLYYGCQVLVRYPIMKRDSAMPPLLFKITRMTLALLLLAFCFLMVWIADAVERWKNASYNPNTWLVTVYCYQALELMASTLLVYMIYTIFPSAEDMGTEIFNSVLPLSKRCVSPKNDHTQTEELQPNQVRRKADHGSYNGFYPNSLTSFASPTLKSSSSHGNLQSSSATGSPLMPRSWRRERDAIQPEKRKTYAEYLSLSQQDRDAYDESHSPSPCASTGTSYHQYPKGLTSLPLSERNPDERCIRGRTGETESSGATHAVGYEPVIQRRTSSVLEWDGLHRYEEKSGWTGEDISAVVRGSRWTAEGGMRLMDREMEREREQYSRRRKYAHDKYFATVDRNRSSSLGSDLDRVRRLRAEASSPSPRVDHAGALFCFENKSGGDGVERRDGERSDDGLGGLTAVKHTRSADWSSFNNFNEGAVGNMKEVPVAQSRVEVYEDEEKRRREKGKKRMSPGVSPIKGVQNKSGFQQGCVMACSPSNSPFESPTIPVRDIGLPLVESKHLRSNISAPRSNYSCPMASVPESNSSYQRLAAAAPSSITSIASTEQQVESSANSATMDGAGGEMPFAWDMSDHNYSAYYEQRVKAGRGSTGTTGDVRLDIQGSNLGEMLDELSEEEPEDSFANYWAL